MMSILSRLGSYLPSDHGFRRRVVIVYALLALINIGAWVWALVAFHDFPALLGIAVVVYGLGLRHAIDADHIAAIDNVTRKFVQQGRPSVSVGFWFAIGHSAVVMIATAAVVHAASSLKGIEAYRDVGGTISALVSAVFLLGLAAMNLWILHGIIGAFRRLRGGEHLESADMDMLPRSGGLLSRLFQGLFRCIGKPWHMAPMGFLFGLSFDTATEVALFGLAATQTANGLSPMTAMVFPLLFAAGMSLLDTTDGLFMIGAYKWAVVEPARKLYYNLLITLMSIAVAVFIGGVQVAGLVTAHAGEGSRVAAAIAHLNSSFNALGIAVVVTSALSWLLSVLIFRRLSPAVAINR